MNFCGRVKYSDKFYLWKIMINLNDPRKLINEMIDCDMYFIFLVIFL